MSILRFALRAAAVALVAFVAFAAVVASVKAATVWQVVPEKSSIGFSGTHAGRTFKGTFKNWKAKIAFDPQNLASSKATVKVDLASAATGDATYDKTLPTADWFNVLRFPEATFVTTSISAASEGESSFVAEGLLSIRGIEVPVVLAFDFVETENEAHLEGTASLKRLAFDIGRGSDAAGNWVSLDIPVTVSVTLKRAE